MSTERFYDDLASHYDLIYPDWHASMARQGAALERVLRSHLPPAVGAEARVLDAAAGIGTQALALAARGFHVTARDLSPAAIARLRVEARERRLTLDIGVSDMRSLRHAVDGPFDAVICCDNALPHLLTDDDISAALAEFRALLIDGGVCACSVRDYDVIDRTSPAHVDYGERHRAGRAFRLWQEWHWLGSTHYDVTFVIEEQLSNARVERVRTTTRYYAVGIPRLLQLMRDAGLTNAHRADGDFFQPLLIARRGAG